MIPTRKIYADPIDVNNRLGQLDPALTQDIFRESVSHGLLAWASCTENHPPSCASYLMWAIAVKAFRDLMIPKCWERSNESNLPFTVNECGKLAIIFNTGDEATGTHSDPCTKNPKGNATRKAVRVNEEQGRFEFYGEIHFSREDLKILQSRETWILLMYRDINLREARCELSKPINMNADGKVDGWDERIILGSIPFDTDGVEVPDDETPQTPNITVNISRRA
jgi:hypothetical protein